MNKKAIALSLILPCYLLGEVNLGEISINETKIDDTNTIQVDLEANEQHQSSSVFDLFKDEASVEVAGGGSSNAKRIYIRGVESSALNITLDGAVQGKNIFQHRGNELGINPDLLKVVNVKTAPDASKAGALGGAIEMTTKDAQDFVKNGKNQGAIVKVGYGTNADSYTGSLTAYGVYDEHYGVVASVSGENSDNYKDGHKDEMYATAYQDRNYLFSFTLKDLNNNDLKLSFNQNSNSGDMLWGRNGSDKGPTSATAILEKIVSTTSSYTLQHNYSGGKLLNLDTNINFTNILVDRKDAGFEYDNDNVGITLQNHFYLDTKSTKNKISLGFQIEDEKTTSTETTTGLTKISPTSSNNQALFVQSTTTINNLDINYGLRFDKYDFETGLGKASDSTYSPNFGLEYKLDKKSKIYANYGESSRMTGSIPFTWMTKINTDPTKGTSYSSDLKAEESTRYELGYNYKHDNLFTSEDTFKFDANLFKSEFKNVIVSKAVDGYSGEGGKALTDIYNSNQEYTSKGFEIKASYYIDNYFGSLSYSQIDTNIFDEKAAGIAKEPLALRIIGGWDSKKVVFNTGVELFYGFSIDYTLTAVDGIDDPKQVTRPGYVTHDISTKYQTNENSPWILYAAVNNLTDKYYAPHTTLADTSGDYRRDMGRDFRFSVKYEF